MRFVLVSIDLCVWPANATYFNNVMQGLQSVLASSSRHAAHIQVPAGQSQTTNKAWLRHTRTLQDALVKYNINWQSAICLSYDKSHLHANDRRDPWHECRFAFSEAHGDAAWKDCAACQTGTIGPAPLIRVNEMIGYDGENRPGPAFRTEQIRS